MIVSFTGDLILQDIEHYTENPFAKVRDSLSDMNLVINLEASFRPPGPQPSPIKNKICTSQNAGTVKFLADLQPLLVNLSNNHINDYGNAGVEYTFDLLDEKKIGYFGAGFESEIHNRQIIENERTVFLCYTLGTDQVSKHLYNEPNLLGPKKFSFEQYMIDINGLETYSIIVLFHWGRQPSRYPYPYQRKIARRLIDNGTDLIVGNHTHIYQAFESYKEKMIFYSLGNFLVPNFATTVDGRDFSVWATKEKRYSIIPVLEISNKNSQLIEILSIRANRKFELEFVPARVDRFNFLLFKKMWVYRLFHRAYLKYRRIRVQFDKVRLPYIRGMDRKIRRSSN